MWTLQVNNICDEWTIVWIAPISNKGTKQPHQRYPFFSKTFYFKRIRSLLDAVNLFYRVKWRVKWGQTIPLLLLFKLKFIIKPWFHYKTISCHAFGCQGSPVGAPGRPWSVTCCVCYKMWNLPPDSGSQGAPNAISPAAKLRLSRTGSVCWEQLKYVCD